MSDQRIFDGDAIERTAQMFAMGVVATAAAALTAATALAAFGVLPWLQIHAGYGDGAPFDIGRWLQLGATLMLLVMALLLPSNRRLLRLELTHRDFRLSIEDVTRAYWAAHAADRAGTFQLAREFDAVRERMIFLRNHPDLAEIEPEVLELAAQMGTEARDLARVYSDQKVARAREMLALRGHEAEEMQARISRAHEITREMKRRLADVEMDEAMARSALGRLREELDEVMAQIEGGNPPPVSPRRPRLRVATDGGE